MAQWLFSTEPDVFPWDKVFAAKRAMWDGIRGTAARKWMRSIAAGDGIWGYHSSPEKALVCLARAVGPAYPDPADPAWLAVDVASVRWLARRVPLAELRAEGALARLPFLRMPRLSVSPVSPAEAEALVRLSGTTV